MFTSSSIIDFRMKQKLSNWIKRNKRSNAIAVEDISYQFVADLASLMTKVQVQTSK